MQDGPNNRKSSYKKRVESLFNERTTWEPTWRDLGDHFAPNAYQKDASETNQGDRRDSAIVDETGVMAVRTAVSGLMGGSTSPVRRWFHLTTQDEQNEQNAAHRWLQEAGEKLEALFGRSNLYTVLPLFYKDYLVFGTAATAFLERSDDGSPFLFLHQQAGTYALACNAEGKVDSFARKSKMTAAQMVSQFGIERVSQSVRSAYKNAAARDKWFDVWHLIQPNERMDQRQLSNEFKPFMSCYFEPTSEEKTLADEGFDEFPVIIGRWETPGQNVYGYSPARDVLGSCRALQAYNDKIQLAIEKEIDPPLNVPAGAFINNVSLLPGALNQVPDGMGGQGLVPTHQVQFRIDGGALMMDRHAARIKRGLFEDLFLMIANSNGEMTAREIVERQEEKIQQLGPVLLNLSHETLDPLIARALAIAFRRGLLPPPPPELEGRVLKVKYVSTLAQAQDLIEAQSIVETLGFAAQLEQAKPGTMDVLDTDAAMREYTRLRRAPAKIVRDLESVQAMREAQAQAAQAQAQAEQAAMQAKTVRDLAAAPTDAQNALTETVKAVEGQQ